MNPPLPLGAPVLDDVAPRQLLGPPDPTSGDPTSGDPTVGEPAMGDLSAGGSAPASPPVGEPARPRWQLLPPLARPTAQLPAIGRPPRPIVAPDQTAARSLPAAPAATAATGSAATGTAAAVAGPVPEPTIPAPTTPAPTVRAAVRSAAGNEHPAAADASAATLPSTESSGGPQGLDGERATPAGERTTPAGEPTATDQAAGPDDDRDRPWTQFTLEWIGIVAGALLVALVIKVVLLQAFVIPSPSMEPTLDISDRVLVLKPAYRLHGIDRGDVVVFDRPEELRINGETSDVIKRVIGLPGETIDAVGGRVRINGVPLEEPWLPAGVQTIEFGPVAIPEGTVWVMGDNRGQSSDSRRFGVLDEDHIIGEAIVRWWPLSRFGGL